jgi:hypothetical protein
MPEPPLESSTFSGCSNFPRSGRLFGKRAPEKLRRPHRFFARSRSPPREGAWRASPEVASGVEYRELRTVLRARGGSLAGPDDARTVLRLCQLEENGIGPVQRRILDVLRKHGRPIALARLAAQVGITPAAFRSVYEPALLRARATIPTRFGVALAPAAHP